MSRMLVLTMLALGAAACRHGGASGDASAGEARSGEPSGTAEVRAEPSARPAPPPAGRAGMGDACPMNVPGTQVAAEETADGIALRFTTTSADEVATLRERVRGMAEMHNRHHTGGEAGGPHGGHGHHHGPRGGMGEGGMGPGGRGDGPGMAMPPPSRATVEELPDGARVVVTPEDPAELQRLQTTVRSRAEHMQQHGCAPMRPMRSMRRGS